jgi:predicted O-methyltransferase YrrM
MYNFTKNWFDVSEIKQNIHLYISNNNVNNILEIGSFEGAFSCYISDNFLDKNGSTLTCVDIFDISDTTSPVYNNIRDVFINNIKSSKNWQKIRLRQMYSIDFFKENIDKYNFIYIDGSHELENIKTDFLESLKIITLNGIIWMDDYAANDNITKLIDSLYENNKESLNIIHKNYQIAFRKIK